MPSPNSFISAFQPQESISLCSEGLLSGKRITATLRRGQAGAGPVFLLGGQRLPASPQYLADASRGVTLLEPIRQQSLSIVEHFLAALSLSGHWDVELEVEGGNELPLLDGSAWPWFVALQHLWGIEPQPLLHRVERPFILRLKTFGGNQQAILAEPCEGLELVYALAYPHQQLKQTWSQWRLPPLSEEAPLQTLLQAGTFGEVAELPALQAKGYALGVSESNTLGLCEDNQHFTRPLRSPQEPLLHKMLDFVGDAALCGLRLAQWQGRFTCLYTGHSGHLSFCEAFKEAHLSG